MEITATNANSMFSDMFWKLHIYGVKADSRNGPVVRIMEPVLTTVLNPRERVLFHKGRDANPVFHLMESVWMLAGRNDVAFPELFNSRIGQYSDNGETFNAAYGYRWRHHFGFDQLTAVITQLRASPSTRQGVVQMWESSDLVKETKDKACNTQLIFEVSNEKLNMTVINRSNDAWYGYAGANIVHFTVLQEFVANAVGVDVGLYRTFSTNLHLYTEMYGATKYLETPPLSEDYDMYRYGEVEPYPLVENNEWVQWLRDAEKFCENPFAEPDYNCRFFTEVAYPVAMVSKVRKEKTGNGMEWVNRIVASDWKMAVADWVERRENAKRGEK